MSKRATSSLKDNNSNFNSFQSQHSGNNPNNKAGILPDPNGNKNRVDLMLTKKMNKAKGGIHPKLQQQS